MAKIEMDVSEYEALKENIKLLKDQKEENQKLTETIDRLNQEKIQALEDSQKQIISTSIVESRQFIVPSIPEDSFQHIGLMVKDILRNEEAYHRNNHYSSGFVDHLKHAAGRVGREVSNWMESRATSTNEVSKSFKVIGLEDYQIQAEEKALKRLTDKAQELLKKEPIYLKAFKDNTELSSTNKQLVESQKELGEKYDKLLEDHTELRLTSLEDKQALNSFLLHVELLLKNTSGIFMYKNFYKSTSVALQKVKTFLQNKNQPVDNTLEL